MTHVTFGGTVPTRPRDGITMQAVNARITAQGTRGAVAFDVTFLRKTPDANDTTIPFNGSELQALVNKVEATIRGMTPAEIDGMNAFRFDFARTRQDADAERPQYEFRSYSTQTIGQASFNTVDVASHPRQATLGPAIADLRVTISRVHDAFLDRQGSVEEPERSGRSDSASQSERVGSKKNPKKQQRHEAKRHHVEHSRSSSRASNGSGSEDDGRGLGLD